ncbi:RNA methyltransferase [Marinibacterium profundimaris]|uniref:RNA methyltransferase n=1 Tax=Marinibacterium profundimaris TaxID=1679460 RepID=A0A225NEF6_9RHOB|nr:RNA methyltransferase [Marinibacterium profundimaris]
MRPEPPFDIFLAGPPGLEHVLTEETRALGFADAAEVPGGVTLRGGWPEVWRVNLLSRGATRVLVRLAEFRAMHLAQLDKRVRRVDWMSILGEGRQVQVETVCRKSKIYHAGAATQRIETAIREALGEAAGGGETDSRAPKLKIMARIEDDLCTLSLDTSGAPLHMRGTKQAVGKAPLRETLAALFLRQCGYDGREPVYDPMCGSGTFPLEAAEIALGLAPGRSRGFAFESLPDFDPGIWAAMRAAAGQGARPDFRFGGSDRDPGAVSMAAENAARAGLDGLVSFRQCPVSEAAPPDGPPGLVMINPPYGARIGDRKLLFGLYGALGEGLKTRFRGWRVGLVTTDGGLAKATGLPWLPTGVQVPHGGLKIRLYRTDPLP